MVNLNRKFFFFIAILAALASNLASAKPRKSLRTKIVQPFQSWPISSSYFLQISLGEENCESIITKECLFRDKFLEAPYFHDTTLTIFLDKISATQLSNSTESRLSTIKDGSYKLRTIKDNLISFDVKNGDISNLTLLDGALKNEHQEYSKCIKTKILYNFYNIYNRQNELEISSGSYKDEYNFDGIKEYIIFSTKNNPFDLMALSKDPNGKNHAINSTKLCKIPNDFLLNVRHVTKEECQFKDNLDNEECSRYATCIDSLTVNECEVLEFVNGE